MELTITITIDGELNEGDRYALEDKIVDDLKELGVKAVNINVWGK